MLSLITRQTCYTERFIEGGSERVREGQRQSILQPPQDGLRMSVREPGALSRANGAYLVVDHLFKRLEVNDEAKEKYKSRCDT